MLGELENDSAAETLTLTALIDDVFGDLNGKGNCSVPQDLAPNGEFGSIYECSFTATIAAELGETANGSEHYQALFTLGILLFVVTFIINLSADLVVRGIRKK